MKCFLLEWMTFSTGVDEVLSFLLEWVELAAGVDEVFFAGVDDVFYRSR